MAKYHVIYHHTVEAEGADEAEELALASINGVDTPVYVGTKLPMVRIEVLGGVATVEEVPDFVDVTIIDEDDERFNVIRELVAQSVTAVRRGQSYKNEAENLTYLLESDWHLDDDPHDYLLEVLAAVVDMKPGMADALVDDTAMELIDVYIV